LEAIPLRTAKRLPLASQRRAEKAWKKRDLPHKNPHNATVFSLFFHPFLPLGSLSCH